MYILLLFRESDPRTRITDVRAGAGINNITVGINFGDFQTLVDNYLPKTAIDQTTLRMAELLKLKFSGQMEDEKGIMKMMKHVRKPKHEPISI